MESLLARQVVQASSSHVIHVGNFCVRSVSKPCANATQRSLARLPITPLPSIVYAPAISVS